MKRLVPMFFMALMVLLGCVEQPTQVLVRLATDIPDIDTVVIRIYDDDDALVRESVVPPDMLAAVPGDGRFHPIGTFGLVPQDDDPNRRFRVVADVTVRREGTVRFETRARSGFVKNNTIRLDIFIAELCIDLAAMCEEEGLTCGIDGCVPEDVPPESLPPIDDDPIPDDPIDPRRYDGGLLDSGVDAPVDAPVDVAFDAATDTMGVDVGFFDGGGDAGVDAPFDGGIDAGGFDAGPLVVGMDDAPIVFPWGGFRVESGQPHVAFREISGAAGYLVTLKVFPAGGEIFQEYAVAGGGDFLTYDITGLTGLPRRVELIVRSCTSPAIIDCSAPLATPRYLDLGRVRCDLDDDGTSDPIVAQSDGVIRAWINGTGSPPESVDAHDPMGPTVTACADLDGDGDAEIVSMQSATGTVAVVDYNGATLSVVSTPFTGSATTIIAGDFDSDGFEDVVFADVNAGVVRFARGASGPDLESPVAIPRLGSLGGSASGRYGRDLAITDLNTDGFIDVLIADANDRDDVSKTDTGLQICYGGPVPFSTPCTLVPVPVVARDQHFGWRVAGLGVSDEGHGAFVVAAPEAGGGNTGAVYEYRNGAAMPVRVDSPAMADGTCCFPNDLTPGPRDYGTSTFVHYAGYGDFDTNHFGRVYRCAGGSCSSLAAPGSVVDAYFGFDVMGELSGDRIIAISRAPGQNGVYLRGGSWQSAVGAPTIASDSRLAE